MRRLKLLLGSLVIGGLIGGLAVYPASRGLRAASVDPLIAGTREICEAIIVNEESSWETVRQRYFTPPRGHGDTGSGSEACDALSAAHSESFHFHPGDAILDLQRNAEGQTGEHSLAAVAARVRTGAGDRTITVRWRRDGSGPWYPEDVISTASGEAPAKASPGKS